MSSEYVDSDIKGLGALAILWDDFYLAPSPTGRKELMAEIRLQEVRFGLSPIDRRRLQWEIKRVEPDKPKPKKTQKKENPIAALKAV